MAVLEQRRALLIAVTGKPGTGKSAFVCETLAQAEKQQGWRAIGRADDELQVDPSTSSEWFCTRILNSLGANAEDESESNADGPADKTQTLIEYLKSAAPVIIGIDRFWPSDSFCHWFTNDFVRRVKASGSSIAIVCAGLHPEKFGSAADVRVDLDHMDKDWARRRFSAASANLAPPLETKELETYVESVSERPELLVSFLRVFHLAEARI
jgi:hypothetical protein